ncbi:MULTISPECIES: hypothetical protein [unclassified Leifsonia]|uniref:hypothetical protein n=1 Tax=unclassified Leifsonia TaxID=2663824 RepID=UPI0006FFBE3D|nr:MULTISPECIES: hypothetical protein [unclassified Leifsonia]KQX05461.1 hypothetical protein ASC59_15165 [Leifsonia sp. Root1293]KRA09094.1 hypothetical protein ASD61_15160 [Leifsonia sp. Root60]
MASIIQVIPDLVTSGLKDLLEGLSALPEPSELQSEGVGIGVASPFRSELAETAIVLKAATRSIIMELQAAEDAIRTTVAQLVQNDESIAADAQAFLSFLDAAVKTELPAAPTPTPSAGGGKSPLIV